MDLTDSVSHFFSEKSKRRGQELFSAGAVRVDRGGTAAVEAVVDDDAGYLVTLGVDRHYIRHQCTCRNRARECQHVWAALLEADRRGYLTERPRSQYLAMWNDALAGSDITVGFGLPRKPAPRPAASAPSAWKLALMKLRTAMEEQQPEQAAGWPGGREILYLIDAPASLDAGAIILEPSYQERKKNGQWSKPKKLKLEAGQIASLPDEADRRAFGLLVGASPSSDYSYGYYGGAYDDDDSATASRYKLSGPNDHFILRALCETGRCFLRRSIDNSDLRPLKWADAPWELWLDVQPDGERYRLTASLRQGQERMEITEPDLLIPGGSIFARGWAAPLRDFGAFAWAGLFRREGAVMVPAESGPELLSQIYRSARLPKVELPEPLRVEEIAVVPQPHLKISPREDTYGNPDLQGALAFDYGGHIVDGSDVSGGVFDAEQRRVIRRDSAAEAQAAGRMLALGFRRLWDYGAYNQPQKQVWRLATKRLPAVVRALTAEQWHIEAEGKIYRQAGQFSVDVRSGIDWFELHGNVQFGDQIAALPKLLEAVRRGENLVQLDDGTCGIIPETWLKKYGLLAGTGEAEGDHLKFKRTQVGLLDALLAAQPEATCDEVFEHARQELARFAGVKAVEAPSGFVGELRPYQKDGLGWLHFLRGFGFGGCLADDMGLGKTIQVLAMIQELRERANGDDKPGGSVRPTSPSLVVVPRSLVFNWKQESARFTPQLRVLDHTGIGRLPAGEHFNDYDLVLTTYGTMLRDIHQLSQWRFEYAILDEGQAIKNAASETAKAARLLQADHRLVLSGTPVQNHLGELWSLFEFLNPGMLGTAAAFRTGTNGNGAGAGADAGDDSGRQLLARAMRPFILRRNKEQVAADLPEKLEQTIFCELEGEQRKNYDELREHFRASLMTRIQQDGINRSKMHILEALLRLRQAACHPGLIDKSRTGEQSAKLESLLANLQEVLDEGHKALVFSQFTSFLSIVRDRLDKEKVVYEYLDGQTRDREARVQRFQTDADCRLFLISLKAGGLGLNLTAAEYVFLLDPWWNPAVESQAIDRAHRIGQSRRVFAYRLIAKGTVEEKVLQLQQTKRDLADAIITADNSLIGKLGREDLELLLG